MIGMGIRMGGAVVADQVKLKTAEAAAALRRHGIHPCLATVLVGDDAASKVYIRNKHTACAKAGILTRDHKLAADISRAELYELLDELRMDQAIHGILVQLPLPDHLDAFEVTSKIPASKDVDGLTPTNLGLLAARRARLAACTPLGIMAMLDHYGITLRGRRAVIINRSGLVGIPLYHLMLQKDATVTVCHSKTRNLADICREADIVVTGVGNPGRFVLTADMIRRDAVIIDVAINRVDGKLLGDADYDDVIKKASYVTPVPGGVGLMTVAMLLRNTVVAAGGTVV